ncbi:uncharacterized protein Tco025E_07571 [Trypanosoma conorhini]|uniref:Uncharacterized protein n=1 Tax=Trypanosoma conorhini TaxID=83891 RepID=A0A422NNR2_9TRYP|nr:uncharacterized protein Tco025E_07571 [Trypanosoma conorhini]RNF07101.1 hypothetical protein Tco025E_07571 [Trypanosoma conorhini]
MLFSGFNVSMCLAGSESVQLLSWRPLREVMHGVFRDLGGDRELFLSVALVQQGLTQDLLSDSGRMVRTTFHSTAPLDATLENVGYTKLSDLRHFSKLLARGWELSRFDTTSNCGFLVVTVILKQVTGKDVILSSMLVVFGSHSTTHLHSLLNKERPVAHALLTAALRSPCFAVAAFTLYDEDMSIVRLMNTQRRLSSIVSAPGKVGSVRRFLEEAEKKLAAGADVEAAAGAEREELVRGVAAARKALKDPRHYIPRGSVEEVKERQELKDKARFEATNKTTSEVPRAAAMAAKEPTSGKAPESQQQPPQVPGDTVGTEKQETSQQSAQLPSVRHGKKTGSHPAEEDANPSEARLYKSKGHMENVLERRHSRGSTSALTSAPTAATKKKDATAALPTARQSPGIQQEKGGNAPVTLPPLPSVGRRGERPPACSPKLPNETDLDLPAQHTPPAVPGRGVMDGLEKESMHSQPPTHAGTLASMQENWLEKEPLGLHAEQQQQQQGQLENKPVLRPAPPLVATGAASCEASRFLSASVPLGSTASTRYVQRTEVPLQKLVFHNIEQQSGVLPAVAKTLSMEGLPQLGRRSDEPSTCTSAEVAPQGNSADANASLTLIPEQDEYVEEEAEGGDGGASEHRPMGNAPCQGNRNRRKHSTAVISSANPSVRTLVALDSRCKENFNVTHDGTMVIVMTDDDFEEYEVDEVIERQDGCESLKSKLLEELLDIFMLGCNAAILAADGRSSSMSTFVLKSVVREVMAEVGATTPSEEPQYKGALSVSMVQVRGEKVLDLLKENSKPQRLVIALSPIFGPCVHDVTRLAVNSAVVFDSTLTTALTHAAKNEREYGIVFISLVLKQKLEDEKDVMVSSLVVSLVGENAGVYAAVLDRSPLVPRALFHYALGGPCFTLALLGFSGDEARAYEMLAVQRRLGEMINRPVHRGSINKFISGIRKDLAPAFVGKLQSSDDQESTKKILRRLDEMVQDAEALLENFDSTDPQAYLNDAEEKQTSESQWERRPPSGAVADASDRERVRSLVCFEQRLLGEGSTTVQDNSVLARNGPFVSRYDVDEVLIREPGGSVPSSRLIEELVSKFLLGHCTALLAAEGRTSAVTPLILRKIAYLILKKIKMESSSTSITGDLLASIALVKDNVTADLLAVDAELAFHRFEVEVSPLLNRRLRGASYHLVASAEGFDSLLAAAVARAEPALKSEDPGIMVVALSLTQHVESPMRDVLLSSFMATTVFDGVSHYTGVLHNSSSEPTELFELALGGSCYTIAMLGISDEEEEVGQLLAVQTELAHVRNQPSSPVSVLQHVNEVKQGILALRELQKTTKDLQQMEYISVKIRYAEAYLKETEAVLEAPVRERGFVPLGA